MQLQSLSHKGMKLICRNCQRFDQIRVSVRERDIERKKYKGLDHRERDDDDEWNDQQRVMDD